MQVQGEQENTDQKEPRSEPKTILLWSISAEHLNIWSYSMAGENISQKRKKN